MNIRYFFVSDVAKRKEIVITYCPTDEMIGDFFTKPLGGRKFRRFRNIIMNCSKDKFGAVNVNELTAIHNAKMMGKVKVEKTSDDPSIPSERHKHEGILGSQECVGSRIGQSKQNV